MAQRWWRVAAAGAVAWGLSICGGSAAHAASVPPVVPGYHVLKDAKADPATLGELLLGELNCTSCHVSDAVRVAPRGAPDLTKAGERLTPQYLKKYLADPHGLKPGATMPDVFHASEQMSKTDAVEFLTHYLVSLGGPVKPAEMDGNTTLVDRGRELYHSVGCVACHAPEKETKTAIPSVPLANMAMKTTVDRLTIFLMNPHVARPSGRMPNLHLNAGEARAIATYLLREQLANPQSISAKPPRVNGLKYAYYEGDFNDCRIQTLDKLKPKKEGTLDKVAATNPAWKKDKFALKIHGAIYIDKPGKYRFHTHSDDGSRLYIDDTLIVDNDGVHGGTEKSGEVTLTKGDHPFILTFFEQAGGEELDLRWEGPDIKKASVPAEVFYSIGGQPMVPLETEPFAVDPRMAEMGKQMFSMLRCVNCHAMPDVQPGPRAPKPLAALDVTDGCLADLVRKGLPQYGLSPDQKSAIIAAINNVKSLAQPLEPSAHVTRQMAVMNCFACHKRGEVGGPSMGRADHFKMTSEFDMGDEGRIPPPLNQSGYKLKPSALEQIIFQGQLHVRPVLAARMPKFDNAKMPGFVEALVKADAPATARAEPKFTEQNARDGHVLVGVKGLGCVNCHGVAGEKSLGMPAMDLATVQSRLNYPWYYELMLGPASKNEHTRMPAFWTDEKGAVPSLGGGARDGQVDAIWNYLSLGTSMPLPAGLLPTGGYELIPTDEPLIHRTFMAEIGPRAVLVGYPERIHVAFDANTVRLAKIWKGRFFDAKGMWDGRGGSALGPLGKDVINLPPGPAVAILPDQKAPWPVAKNKERNVGGKFLGYRLDKKQMPVFRYQIEGITVEEQPLPLLLAGGPQIKRQFTLVGSKPASGAVFLLIAGGAKVEARSAGEWLVDGKLTVRLDPKVKTITREEKGFTQVLVPADVTEKGTTYLVEMSW